MNTALKVLIACILAFSSGCGIQRRAIPERPSNVPNIASYVYKVGDHEGMWIHCSELGRDIYHCDFWRENGLKSFSAEYTSSVPNSISSLLKIEAYSPEKLTLKNGQELRYITGSIVEYQKAPE